MSEEFLDNELDSFSDLLRNSNSRRRSDNISF